MTMPINHASQGWDAVIARTNRVRGTVRQGLRTLAASRTNYWLAYAVDCVCGVVLGYLGVRTPGAGLVAFASFICGAFVFSFVEYALHRWCFHARTWVSGEIHAAHHREPREPSALPFWSSALSAPIFALLSSRVLGAHATYFALSGFFVAYFAYGVLHHLQHCVRLKDVPFEALRRRWAAHAIHHGRMNVNYGVTTSLWDRLLGTYQAVPCHSLRPTPLLAVNHQRSTVD